MRNFKLYYSPIEQCIGVFAMDPFLGEIKAVGFNYAPLGWAQCNGQTMSIQQYGALFALLGTTYGGDGRQTFGLPNLQGRAIVGTGQGAGLSNYAWGQTGGAEAATLSLAQIPQHVHALQASDQAATNPGPQGSYLPTSVGKSATPLYAGSVGTLQAMNQSSIGPAGSSQAHPNVQPYLSVYYIIALQGIYPPRP